MAWVRLPSRQKLVAWLIWHISAALLPDWYWPLYLIAGSASPQPLNSTIERKAMKERASEIFFTRPYCRNLNLERGCRIFFIQTLEMGINVFIKNLHKLRYDGCALQSLCRF